jgi:hypothetical protein
MIQKLISECLKKVTRKSTFHKSTFQRNEETRRTRNLFFTKTKSNKERERKRMGQCHNCKWNNMNREKGVDTYLETEKKKTNVKKMNGGKRNLNNYFSTIFSRKNDSKMEASTFKVSSKYFNCRRTMNDLSSFPAILHSSSRR